MKKWALLTILSLVACHRARARSEQTHLALDAKDIRLLLERKGSLGSAFLSRPFVGDLMLVYVVDMPNRVRTMNEHDRDALHLDADGLDTLARKNLQAAFPAVHLVAVDEGPLLTNDAGDDYDAALLALPSLWQPLAHQLGSLVVTAPARNRVLASKKADVSKLREATDKAYSREEHSLSRTLFEWSPSGWKPLP